jgi:ribosome-associated translation inhibitor RaiA
MFIEIRSMEFPLTEAIRRHVESRVGGALVPVAQRVVSVTVRLRDLNAGRVGVDNRCRLVATLRRRRAVVAGAIDGDLYAAVDAAAGRDGARVSETRNRSMTQTDRSPAAQADRVLTPSA